nr:hypothetical protein BaRGS_026625 [Batillaria attramentaria]
MNVMKLDVGTLCQNSTWLYYSGFCYILSPQDGPDSQKTWYDARRTCNMYGGDLASVQSVDENSFLTYAMDRRITSNILWIGLNDIKRRNYFEWHDNSEVDYTHWGPHQPDENIHSNNPDDRALVSLLRMPDMKHARNVSQIWMGMQISSVLLHPPPVQ